MNWKNHSHWSKLYKTILLAWMSVAIPAGCGGGEGDDDVTPQPQPSVVTNAPAITLLMMEANVFGGAVVEHTDSSLLIGGEKVAEWTAGTWRVKSVDLSFDGKGISSGSILSQKGTLMLTVTNDGGKSSTKGITLKDDAITGLQSLDGVLKVDSEVDLLSGITIAKGAELAKTEMVKDGQRTEISDPHHFTPEYPGQCSIVFTVRGLDGNTAEVTADNLTIKSLEYKEVSIDNANMIQEKYPRYNNLQQTTKDFIYPHLIASYAACNRSKQDDRVHIIMWETTDASDVENIWQWNDPSDHAYEWYYRIRALSPDVSIKWCDAHWDYLEEYIKQHSNKIYIISQAAGSLWWISREGFNNNPEIAPQKALLENENVIIIGSGWNWWPSWRKVYNENTKNWDDYNRSSTNSKKNNKITVTWYNSWGGDNYFSPDYIEYWWLRSAMPIWYDKDKWNIVMPMIPLIRQNNQEDQNTTSSFPTAVTSGVIWNAISVIMSNHPWITAEDAMTIIVNNYLKKEKFQYKDETTNWELVDGDYRYFINIQKLLKSELLQSDKIDKIQFNSDLVELPSSNGICYTGKWIQFEYNWKKYIATNENQSILNQALKTWNIKWYWHKDSFKKYGWTNFADFNVYVVDKDWKRIPDLHTSINKSVM